MSLLKRYSAAAAALLMALSLSSCGKSTTWAAEINGKQIRAGIFIYYQSSAISDAYTMLPEGETDVLNTTIEDQPSKDWINNKAIESIRKYAVIEKKFDELGLSFSNNEDKIVSATAEQWWDYLGEQYEDMGVSEQSYIDIGINSQKENAIFNYYYGEGGEKEVSEDDIKAYLNDNNARIKYIEMTLKDAEGNVLKSDDKADIKTMAEEYISRLKDGEDMDTISKEYNDYVASLSGSDESAEGEETGTEDITITADGVTAEEDTAPDYGTVISKDSTYPAASVTEKVFSGDIAIGDYVLVEDYEAYYIVNRLDIFADPDYFESAESSALHAMKDEEFDAMTAGWISEENVVINQEAVDRYKLDKLVV